MTHPIPGADSELLAVAEACVAQRCIIPMEDWLDERRTAPDVVGSGRTHELKTDAAVFDAVARGDKTHEIRMNDRNFQVGDSLLLRETQSTGADMRLLPGTYPLVYTGRTATRIISHIQTGYGLADGWCILSFRAAAKVGANVAAGIPTWQEREKAFRARVEDGGPVRITYMKEEIAALRAALAANVAAHDKIDHAVFEWASKYDIRLPNGAYRDLVRLAAGAPAEPAVDRDAGPDAETLIEWINAGAFGMESANNRRIMCDHVRRLATPASPAAPEPAPLASKPISNSEAAEGQWAGDSAPQVAQASQPTSAEELQQKEHIPPSRAEPASQHDASQLVNLRFKMMDAYDCGEKRHPQEFMRATGINYGHATPQSMGEQWWFWNCENVPFPLPSFLSVLTVSPHEAIGHGLSREIADKLASRCRAQGGITNDSKGLPTSAEGKDSEQGATRQYYYKTNACTARSPISPNCPYSPDCACWHDEGAGPLANEPGSIREWRASTGKDTDKEAK